MRDHEPITISPQFPQYTKCIYISHTPSFSVPYRRDKLIILCFFFWTIGTALGSITSLLSHADSVFATDYPSPTILEALSHNLYSNLPSKFHPRLTITGHEWGTTTDKITQGHAYSFSRIIACDTLWLDGEHEALAKSMRHFLSPDPNARCWVVAGWHTGKRKVASFFDTAKRRARLVPEWIGEVDTDFQVREWKPLGEGEIEGEGEKNRWMVVAVLKINNEGNAQEQR